MKDDGLKIKFWSTSKDHFSLKSNFCKNIHIQILSLFLSFVFNLAIVNILHANSMTLQTYYPPPVAAYDRLRLVPQPEITASACEFGSIYVNATKGSVPYLCQHIDADGEWGGISGVWSQTGNDIYLIDGTNPSKKKFGIGTGAGSLEFKLTLDNDGGIIAKDTLALGDAGYTALPNLGPGARFIWYPKKAAIRAGEVSGTQWDDANIGNHSVAFGKNTKASAARATILGGEGNTVSGPNGTIAGGLNNSVTISAGNSYGTIGGGQGNTVSSVQGFIAGGLQNTVSGDNSTILGGSTNVLSATASAIGGGQSNAVQANSNYGTISGGNSNTISNAPAACLYSTISGGLSNTIVATTGGCSYVSIGGGNGNVGSGDYSTISGGKNNGTNGANATVSGGELNVAGADGSAIIGGKSNQVTAGSVGTIAGGQGNSANGAYPFIGGGNGNVSLNNDYGVIGGGATNMLDGSPFNSNSFSFIGGGLNNKIVENVDYDSMIPGGEANSILGVGPKGVLNQSSLAAGRNMNLVGNFSFVWGYSITPVTVNSDSAFIINSGNVGIGAVAPSAKLEVNGNIQIDTGTLFVKNIPTLGVANQLILDGTTKALGKDVAEIFTASEEVEAGDLLVIDENQKMKLKKSALPYDKRAVGIVSATPAMVFEEKELQLSPQLFTKGTRPPVALAGQVLAKVSLENGPITYGDLLTSSKTPGHVMKATDQDKSNGSIVGKALQAFPGGPNGEKTGTIIVFLAFQ